MNYCRYKFTVNPPEPGSDILIACLAEMGFESFENNTNGFTAYIPESLNKGIQLNELVFDDFSYAFDSQKIEQVNWNSEWEKHFNPVVVSDECCIRAPFHTMDKNYLYDLIIMPKMSFGTGHHDTTFLMCKNMLGTDFKEKKVLDIGTGTGVLAILANKLGAIEITGSDIDDWSVENAKENCITNHCPEIKIVGGNGDLLNKEEQYDIILANINKNTLITYLPDFSKVLKPFGIIFMSGFFKTDIDEISRLALKQSLKLIQQEFKNEWAVIALQKEN